MSPRELELSNFKGSYTRCFYINYEYWGIYEHYKTCKKISLEIAENEPIDNVEKDLDNLTQNVMSD